MRQARMSVARRGAAPAVADVAEADAAVLEADAPAADAQSGDASADVVASAPAAGSGVTRVGYAPIVRVDAPRREIELCATSEAIDSYGTVFDYAASKDAFTRWIGNVREMHERRAVGRRRGYAVDPQALEHLVVNTVDPVTGRQPRRGHADGWAPKPEGYQPADTVTDLRRPENAPLQALRMLLTAQGLRPIYDHLRACGIPRSLVLRVGGEGDAGGEGGTPAGGVERQVIALALNEVEHRRTKVRSPQTNGFVERFHSTIRSEFFQVALRQRFYASADDLQPNLNAWLVHYNTERPHRGYPNRGKPPMGTINDYLTLVRQEG